jgi:hypothetical protein
MDHEAAVRSELETMLASARDLAAFGEISTATPSPIALDPDEYLVVVVQDAFRLLETSRPAGKLRAWTGSVGTSIGPRRCWRWPYQRHL